MLSNISSDVDSNYLLLFLKAYLRDYIKRNSKKGSVPYITLPMLQSFEVALPSMKNQHKIADMLMNYDAITTSITDGLPAEIEGRRKQYEYYRDKLLTFEAKAV